MLYVAGQTGGDLANRRIAQKYEDEVHATFKRIGMILKDAATTSPTSLTPRST